MRETRQAEEAEADEAAAALKWLLGNPPEGEDLPVGDTSRRCRRCGHHLSRRMFPDDGTTAYRRVCHTCRKEIDSEKARQKKKKR
jgi:hypothetical protein